MGEIRITEVRRQGNSEIEVEIDVPEELESFFRKNQFRVEYEDDIGGIGDSIAIVPFVGTLLPVAWMTGTPVRVPVFDETLHDNLPDVKRAYEELVGESISGDNPLVVADELVDDDSKSEQKSGLLFSGGVDSLMAYAEHSDTSPHLLSIDDGRGREWEVDQSREFASERDLEFSAVSSDLYHRLHTGNLNDEFADTLGVTFWTGIVYGIDYLAHCAPLARKFGLDKIIFSSTYKSSRNIIEANHPDLVEAFSWSGTQSEIVGGDMSRPDKCDYIGDNIPPNSVVVRSCNESGVLDQYRGVTDDESTGRDDPASNCMKCRKCYYTALGFLAAGHDPSAYGFEMDSEVLTRIRRDLEGGEVTLAEYKVAWWEQIAETISAEAVPYANGDEFADWIKTFDFSSVAEEPTGY